MVSNMVHRFVIIASGWNCEGYVKPCIDSILNQTYPNWEAAIISDGSTDVTNDEIGNWVCGLNIPNTIMGTHYMDNEGAARKRFEAIHVHSVSPEDIIVFLGLDDELLPNALERIAQEYDNGKLCTYGNWIDNHGYMCPPDSLDFPDEIHATRDYRKVKFRSTAPNTFKRKLFDRMSENDFKVNGEWIKATTESPMMFAALEMSGKDRIGVIKGPIYLYNKRGNDNARNRMPVGYQDMVYKEIVSRPKFDLLP